MDKYTIDNTEIIDSYRHCQTDPPAGEPQTESFAALSGERRGMSSIHSQTFQKFNNRLSPLSGEHMVE
jgi:hypothetical protein